MIASVPNQRHRRGGVADGDDGIPSKPQDPSMRQAATEESWASMGLGCANGRSAQDLKAVTKHSKQQDKRLDAIEDALESKGDLYEDIRQDVVDLREELENMKQLAGQHKAKVNLAKASTAVLHLADTFDQLDLNSSGSIDVAELRRGLHLLGLDSHSTQANMVVERYTDHQTIDIKVFATLVKDIHLLLTFDRDGSCVLSPPRPLLATMLSTIPTP